MSTPLRLGLVAGFVLALPAALFAQNLAAPEASAITIPYDDQDSARAPYVIFSNLSPTPGDRYDSRSYTAFTVAGRGASGGVTETLQAIRFVPTENVAATVLSAAIGYTDGTKLVKLGIYSNDNTTGTVGTVLPGGEVSTTTIPDLGGCCQLTTVTLPGAGVSLTAGTPYWLVVSADDVNGPDFKGGWQLSHFSENAYLTPPSPWFPVGSQWPAAQISGTRLRESLTTTSTAAAVATDADPSRSSAVIFTNLDHTPDPIYLAGAGSPIAGSAVSSFPEAWEALPFTPKSSSHAKTLAAAIAYVSGTKLVELGIYSDMGGVPGTPLPGALGSTTDIPTAGTCCELAEVTFPGPGVALTGGTKYWLVIAPDDVNAPSFFGFWQRTGLAIDATKYPEQFGNWSAASADWLAAKISGSTP